MTLAKKLKIENLKRQREFIVERLSEQSAHTSPNGDVSLVYFGKVFPEVISYFRDQGFQVDELISDAFLTETGGLHAYRFTISDSEYLSETEQKLAEAVIYAPPDESTDF